MWVKICFYRKIRISKGRWDLSYQYRNQEIGLEMQERVAIKLKDFFPVDEYHIHSNGTNGADIIIKDQEGKKLFECEVKTAIECFTHTWYNRKLHAFIINVRRGMFSMKPKQLNYDFYAFVVRFTDLQLNWNGDFETWWIYGKELKEYLEKQTLNCINYKICIDKMIIMGATLDFNIIQSYLFNNKF